MEVITPVHAHAFTPVTEAEYLAIDAAGETKYELIDGRLYAMAGGTADHNHISGSIYMALRLRLRGQRCTPFNSDQRVFIESLDSYLYPDISVACAPFTWRDDKRTTLIGPRLVCEVLSPGTRDRDLSVKREAYQAIPQLEEMLFVSPEPRMVEHYHRVAEDQWLMTRVIGQGDVKLDAFGLTLPLDEIYADLDLLSASD